MRVTDLNLNTLVRELERHGGVIPGRIEPSAARGLKRCIDAGLLQMAGSTWSDGWVLSPAGERVVREHLERHPVRYNPSGQAPDGYIVEVSAPDRSLYRTHRISFDQLVQQTVYVYWMLTPRGHLMDAGIVWPDEPTSVRWLPATEEEREAAWAANESEAAEVVRHVDREFSEGRWTPQAYRSRRQRGPVSNPSCRKRGREA